MRRKAQGPMFIDITAKKPNWSSDVRVCLNTNCKANLTNLRITCTCHWVQQQMISCATGYDELATSRPLALWVTP